MPGSHKHNSLQHKSFSCYTWSVLKQRPPVQVVKNTHVSVVLALKGDVSISKNGLSYNAEDHCKKVL